MGNININLEKPDNFNAKKIAEKKIMGIKVLKASQRQQVY